MPTYNYECSKCYTTTEIIQKITEDSLTHCKVCNEDTLNKVLYPGTFVLHGKGWYATDFKHKK